MSQKINIMKLFLSVWFTIVLTVSIGIISSFMAKYGSISPKNTPIDEIFWAFLAIFNLWIYIYIIVRELKKENKSLSKKD